MISFAVCRCCGCLGFWVDGVTLVVVAMLFMGASSLAFGRCTSALKRGMYLHAERLLAKAGVASGKVFERSFLGGPRVAWGSQSPEGRMALQARGAEPLSRLVYLAGRGAQELLGRALREGKARRDG